MIIYYSYNLAMKYANQATQALMELLMECHLQQNKDSVMKDEFWIDMVNDTTTRPRISRLIRTINLLTPLNETGSSARAALSRFTMKGDHFYNGQLDTTMLRMIMRNCRLFDGWLNYESPSEGRLQNFNSVAKMRNEFIGHNNSNRLS